MKKMIQLMAAIILVCILSGCCISHEWEEATCESPKICVKCNTTEGEVLEHDWIAATCEAPETCSICRMTQGNALTHRWQEATCETAKICINCQMEDGDAPGHGIHGGIFTVSNDQIIHSGECKICGKADCSNIYRNWEEFGKAILLGRWYFVAMQSGNTWIAAPDYITDETYIEFYNDGTAKYTHYGDVEGKGTWNMYYTEILDKSEDDLLTYIFQYNLYVDIDGKVYNKEMQYQVKNIDALFIKDNYGTVWFDSAEALGK